MARVAGLAALMRSGSPASYRRCTLSVAVGAVRPRLAELVRRMAALTIGVFARNGLHLSVAAVAYQLCTRWWPVRLMTAQTCVLMRGELRRLVTSLADYRGRLELMWSVARDARLMGGRPRCLCQGALLLVASGTAAGR